MVRTDSARDAAASIDMDITREEKTEHLYAPVLWITIASNDRQEYTLKSCNSVSNSSTIFTEPIRSIDKATLPEDWKKRDSHLAIYIKDAELKGMPELAPLLIGRASKRVAMRFRRNAPGPMRNCRASKCRRWQSRCAASWCRAAMKYRTGSQTVLSARAGLWRRHLHGRGPGGSSWRIFPAE